MRGIIKESVKKILKEYVGDGEEYGLYYNEFYDMPEDEYENLQQQRDQWAIDYKDDMDGMKELDDIDTEELLGHMDDAYDPGGYL